ncbi:hypothetical protein EYF80_028465 [Liparis tanakae]|uniref:Uncharacterized protein n=1 Tax=Liparis tanakae TaxID=230148 RepID=A0A4Z2H629_9TELE|nr:hypothetical protein EYF80_028465 [Liparis tanakae]
MPRLNEARCGCRDALPRRAAGSAHHQLHFRANHYLLKSRKSLLTVSGLGSTGQEDSSIIRAVEVSIRESCLKRKGEGALEPQERSRNRPEAIGRVGATVSLRVWKLSGESAGSFTLRVDRPSSGALHEASGGYWGKLGAESGDRAPESAGWGHITAKIRELLPGLTSLHSSLTCLKSSRAKQLPGLNWDSAEGPSTGLRQG